LAILLGGKKPRQSVGAPLRATADILRNSRRDAGDPVMRRMFPREPAKRQARVNGFLSTGAALAVCRESAYTASAGAPSRAA
jgi:hypothetical protein